MRQSPTDAYRQVNKLALTPRAAEAEAFTKAARLLHQARQGAFDYAAYAAALRFNQELWTIIQAEQGNQETALPADLRRDTLNLSLFVDKQTIKALSHPAVGHLDSLIEINRSIARGLTPRIPAGISQPA
ncbi:MAG: flagellar biosynthesis regulator FlaF [Proteobacteria bacterium]|nr:flagellar biosynthesis regulator FlaF [Pseudomonadota bacterium]